jgi:hypothetical protein
VNTAEGWLWLFFLHCFLWARHWQERRMSIIPRNGGDLDFFLFLRDVMVHKRAYQLFTRLLLNAPPDHTILSCTQVKDTQSYSSFTCRDSLDEPNRRRRRGANTVVQKSVRKNSLSPLAPFEVPKLNPGSGAGKKI